MQKPRLTTLSYNWPGLIRHDIQILGTEAVIQYSASHLFVNCYRAQISTSIKILFSVPFDYTAAVGQIFAW